MQKLTSAPGIPEKTENKRICLTCKAEFESFPYSYYCPACKIERAKAQAEENRKEEERRIERFIEKRELDICDNHWMPPGNFYLGTNLTNFNSNLQPKAVKAVKAIMADTGGRGLFLWGPVGTGKTHLAAAIFNHYWEKWDRLKRVHPDARFLREYDIFARLRASFQKDAKETESEILDDITCALIVIIDDLCKYQPSDTSFRNRIYYEIIDRLWTDGSKLVITANISPAVLAQELGAPTTDRIRDMCQAIEMKGPSQRGKIGKETP